MLDKEVQAALINVSMDGELESFNRYWLNGFIQETNFFDDRNMAQRNKIMRFLSKTSVLTQRLYLELCYVCR